MDALALQAPGIGTSGSLGNARPTGGTGTGTGLVGPPCRPARAGTTRAVGVAPHARDPSVIRVSLVVA